MIERVTARRSLAVLGTGFAGAQAGHLLAYELRFGGAAMQLQSSGVHAYFPTIARTGLGMAAAALLAAAFLIGAARVAGGRRIEAGSAPSFWRLLPVLYTVQLACFGTQETLEALVGGGHASSAPLLLMWGAAGQLPIAVVTSLTVRWLLATFEPALAVLRIGRLPSYLTPGGVLAVQTWPLATAPDLLRPVVTTDPFRGPPSF
jgi:hypothetical protein